MHPDNPFHKAANYTVLTCSMTFMILLVIGSALFVKRPEKGLTEKKAALILPTEKIKSKWQVPDTSAIPHDENGDLIRYGRELVSHTSAYLGPEGSVAKISNGMNCQNCHLQAGTKPFGNNYIMVASTYPKFRARSGTVESVEKRINDCVERSLNGRKLDDESRELKAIKAYILWVGSEIKKDEKPDGAGLLDLPTMDRPADPGKGKAVYVRYCERCHGVNARGRKIASSPEWLYPPLWGDSSYNIGAGLYRLSRFAAYVKSNMPEGTTYENPVLTDEEAWDVAAYINSLPRPHKDLSSDWPDIASKPFDHPFGPYKDQFSERQHKFGPFTPIIQAKAK